MGRKLRAEEAVKEKEKKVEKQKEKKEEGKEKKKERKEGREERKGKRKEGKKEIKAGNGFGWIKSKRFFRNTITMLQCCNNPIDFH